MVARINMDRWEENMLVAIRRMILDIYLFTKYVDDMNLAVSLVSAGWRWESDLRGDSWSLRWNQKQEERDRDSGETAAKRTFRLIREQADRIISGLAFTTGLPEDNADRKCPC